MAHAHSAALREAVFVHDHRPNPPTPEIPVRAPGQSPKKPRGGGSWTDPDLQTLASGTSLPGTLHFEGIPANGSLPPDTNLAVGDTQVVQIVNTQFEVFDKSTHLPVPPFDVTGPVAIHTLFASIGGLCGSADGGDPIVLYDRIAGRWFVSQLEYTATFATNLICIAVSDSSD